MTSFTKGLLVGLAAGVVLTTVVLTGAAMTFGGRLLGGGLNIGAFGAVVR